MVIYKTNLIKIYNVFVYFYNDNKTINKQNKAININVNSKQKKIVFTFNKMLNEKQKKIVFFKHKFGLYKHSKFFEKRIKNNIFNILNYVKYNELTYKPKNVNKKHKIFFSKKFNKLFFRSGRAVLLNKLNIKKYLIQKYISKKINHLIKKPDMSFIKQTTLNLLLINCGVFYTLVDSNKFINMFGIAINNVITYNYMQNININDLFSIIYTKYIFKYLKKKKKKIIFNLKKIKLYKFRLKHYTNNKNHEWIPINRWILDYSCLYVSKYSNFEFDIKSLSGFYLYHLDLMTLAHYFNNINISLYMSRLYNWKYIV